MPDFPNRELNDAVRINHGDILWDKVPVLYRTWKPLLQIEPNSLFKFFRRKAVRFAADPVMNQHPPAKTDLLAYPFTEFLPLAQILSAQSEIPPR